MRAQPIRAPPRPHRQIRNDHQHEENDMILPSIPMHKADTARLSFDIIPYSPDRVTVAVFEKDKGGTGSTGTAMAVIELLLWLGVRVHIVDLADTQLDLAVPYANIDGTTVHPAGDDRLGEDGAVLRAIAGAGPAEVVIVQFPGASIGRIDRLHQLLVHIQSRIALPFDVSIIWTMDSDQNSRDLLALTLNSALPGTLHVNWPEWNGEQRIPADLTAAIAAQDGVIFSMPALAEPFYQAFKADRVAPQSLYQDDDFVTQAMLDLWLTSVAKSVGARW